MEIACARFRARADLPQLPLTIRVFKALYLLHQLRQVVPRTKGLGGFGGR